VHLGEMITTAHYTI